MKELLQNIDNWTLVKILGGVTILFSSIISFGAYFLKDYFLNKWKSKQQKEIENLKALANQNSLLINNLTNSISNIYLASNQKRITYLETLWGAMMELKEKLPNIVFTSYSILSKEEITNLPTTNNKFLKQSISMFDYQEFLLLSHKLKVEVEKTRPFIGEKIWIIYFVYNAFIGRLTYLIKDGLEKGKVVYWKDDLDFIKQILSNVITSDELKQLSTNDFTFFQNILNFIELKALNDISEQISGKRMTEETIKQAIILSNLTKNTNA